MSPTSGVHSMFSAATTTSHCVPCADNVNIKGGTAGIQLTLSREGRPSGECYVELCSEADLEAALKKHNNNMGHRYVEGMKCVRHLYFVPESRRRFQRLVFVRLNGLLCFRYVSCLPVMKPAANK